MDELALPPEAIASAIAFAIEQPAEVDVGSPGAIDTPSLRDDALGSDGESAIDALNERSPIGRIGTPEEVANVVAFFASDAASYINGEELYVDGGLKG